jgi:hypothetical protein
MTALLLIKNPHYRPASVRRLLQQILLSTLTGTSHMALWLG